MSSIQQLSDSCRNRHRRATSKSAARRRRMYESFAGVIAASAPDVSCCNGRSGWLGRPGGGQVGVMESRSDFASLPPPPFQSTRFSVIDNRVHSSFRFSSFGYFEKIFLFPLNECDFFARTELYESWFLFRFRARVCLPIWSPLALEKRTNISWRTTALANFRSAMTTCRRLNMRLSQSRYVPCKFKQRANEFTPSYWHNDRI